MLKQQLQQKMLQKLLPQQIQLIKLLEIPTFQLEQRIKKELEENPALEEGIDDDEEEVRINDDSEDINSTNNEDDDSEDNEFSIEDYIQDDEIPEYRTFAKNYSKDEPLKEIPFSIGITFHEYLENQLQLCNLNDYEQSVAKYIIGNIDDDGYLRRSLENIIDDIAFSQNIKTTLDELKAILKIIQGLDPAGVGAQNLQECLYLQLERIENDNTDFQLAKKIISECFNEFTKKHYDKIEKKLSVTSQELKKAIDIILKLNPKPGSAYNDSSAKSIQHIIPDFILELNNGKLELSLTNPNIPELRINKTYASMIDSYNKKDKQQKEAITFVKQKLDSAKWFIEAIRQRHHTMLITMQAIVDYQREYFIEGDETKLKPMILKDIAKITGLDISTISRVANSKYIQTHFGIFPLKSFFSEAMQTDSGEEVSSREIKKILQDCINNEDKKNPMTDEELMQVLQEKGYKIARRTVAKYREQLNIPVGRLRKEL